MAEQALAVKLRAGRRRAPTQSRLATTKISGFCHPAFRRVEDMLSQQMRTHPGGVAVSAYHRGECIIDLWSGVRDLQGSPWLRETMAPSFSTTKGVCSTLLHICADRGLVDYNEKVATYWPEFAQGGKGKITVRQVLTHQAGLYHIRRMIDEAGRMLDWTHMIKAIEQAAPDHTPGTRTGYHALTYGFIVGEIVQRVTDQSFSEFLQNEIAEPLGLDGLYIGAPCDQLHRVAELTRARPARRMAQRVLGNLLQQQVYLADGILHALGVTSQLRSFHDAMVPQGMIDFEIGSAETLQAPIPAANGLFTARSLSKLYAMLAGGGKVDGVRLLSADTVHRVAQHQPATGRHAVIPMDLQWRLGYHGVFTRAGFEKDAYGHFGVGGSGAWAHPGLNLSFALVTNGGARSPMGRLSTEAIASARKR